jgi:N-acetylmuramoyl-L-alanine amidase
MKNAMPCVGLMVLGGSLSFILAPDEQSSIESQLAAASSAFPIVILDAGHGGKDDGARANGLVEKELTLDVAQRAEKLLQQYGFRTVMTRADDSFQSLPERTAVANQTENSVFISIHFNHANGGSSTGVETFYASEKVAPEAAWNWVGFFNKPEESPSIDSGETLAGFIQASLVMRTEATNRGIKGRPLYVVRHTRSPAVLVECGFITNPFEARMIANSEYRGRLSKSIAEGVMSYTKSRPRSGTAPRLAQAERY